ncbi:hypothetical protein AB0395_22250 [Streptosporangium sp. NPDC051023]|uniref:hypothetical protein n=1 Tax=Streptosporangium sp. NPDC051023 TaxID=3155410 RepID=UPI0034501AF4
MRIDARCITAAGILAALIQVPIFLSLPFLGAALAGVTTASLTMLYLLSCLAPPRPVCTGIRITRHGRRWHLTATTTLTDLDCAPAVGEISTSVMSTHSMSLIPLPQTYSATMALWSYLCDHEIRLLNPVLVVEASVPLLPAEEQHLRAIAAELGWPISFEIEIATPEED